METLPSLLPVLILYPNSPVLLAGRCFLMLGYGVGNFPQPPYHVLSRALCSEMNTVASITGA